MLANLVSGVRAPLAALALLGSLGAAALAQTSAPPAPASAAPAAAEAPAALQFVKGPYLIYPGKPGEMSLLWQSGATETGKVAWGEDDKYSAGTMDSAEYGDAHQHRADLTGLRPGQLYHYRVESGGETKTGSFRAAPAEDSKSASFFVYGDVRTDGGRQSQPDGHESVAGAILAKIAKDPASQSIIIFSGDFSYYGRTEASWTNDFFNPAMKNIETLLASMPLDSCLGNHEKDGVLFKKYFPYPFAGARYYSIDYGPAHFVFLDQYTDYTTTSTQVAWLKKDLAETKKPWKFIVLHEPGWTAYSKEVKVIPHPNNLEVQQVVQPICKEFGVAAVLCGHNHFYSRAEVDGVAHITSGGGGAPLYDLDPKADKIVAATKSLSFCEATIDEKGLHCVAYTPDGTVIDDFTIAEPPKPAAAQ